MVNKNFIIQAIILIILAGAGLMLGGKIVTSQTNNQNIKQSNAAKIPQETIIKIAQSPVAISAFPLFVAQEKNFFTQNGLKVKLETMQTAISVQALLTKRVDYIAFAKEAVTASQNGAPIKIIMAYGKNSCFALATQPQLKINSIKKIVVAVLLSPPHYAALKLINDNNLSAEVIAAGENLGAVNAIMESKQADASIQSIISTLKLTDQGYTFSKTLDDENVPQGLATTDDKIKNNPEEIKKVIKSLESTLQFIQNNPAETKELLLKFSKMEKTEANQKIAEEAYPAIKQTFSVKDAPSQEGINTLIKLGKVGAYKTFQDVANQKVSQEDISKSFDFRFIK